MGRTENRATVSVASIRVEHLRKALGIGTARPRLSWTVETSSAGWKQVAYEIESRAPTGELRGRTGRIESDQSVLVVWPFAPLSSRETVEVQVRVWGNDGRPSSWSAPAVVEAGLLHPQDWTARFITPDWEEDLSRPGPCPLLRREFEVGGDVVRARLYVTALGVYEVQINGTTVGDQVLAPGWTSYRHRLTYQTYDVTSLIRKGRNAIGAILGDGWFRGRLGFGGGRRNIYGERLALLAQLEIDYANGTRDCIVTDETWRAATGPILASDLYDGETYDARLERPGWSEPGYDDGGWSGVRRVEWDLGTLVAPSGPPARRIELVSPVRIFESPSGKTVVDFGQNLVGRVRITVQGPAGHAITFRHAEVLDKGELGTRPLRTAKATDRYILRGKGTEIWEPRFTYHGFRYVEVDGWPGELTPDNLAAVVCHSDMERTGWFECSDPLVNRLHENVVWSMRGNFLSIPTDCPQRDERLGWTGDIQVFAPAATFLYDCAGFLQSWLADLAAEQAEDGVVPVVVPNVLEGGAIPVAAWGDAAVIVPWILYQHYGDTGILEAQWESMRSWVDFVASVTGERRLWDQGVQFGDWLDPSAPPERPGDGRTDPGVVATAYFARSAELVGKIAQILGKTETAQHYLNLSTSIRAAFNREYVTPAGRVISDSPTAYALALEFALITDEDRRRYAGTRLVDLVRQSGYRISTGFVGTPLICDALCHVGALEDAYRLLMQKECPSWLYPVTMGATTIWERWDSMLPDGSINAGEMTSFNHYALGAVADWLHRTVAGLAPAEPGYRRLEIRPCPGGGLTHARAVHRTPYGMAECSWKIDGDQIEVSVVVPPNTVARVTLPGSDRGTFEVGSGQYRWQYPYRVPQRARHSLNLDTTLAELANAPEACAVVLAILRRHDPVTAGSVEERFKDMAHISLRQAVAIMPRADQLRSKLQAALQSFES
ncbi:MAG: family 78 glycoside hydrolase catalytic domain [Firmicutes bacterium]|nr:family 78 glycoside hydrolase catalytic domain [Bacillota bacterium]